MKKQDLRRFKIIYNIIKLSNHIKLTFFKIIFLILVILIFSILAVKKEMFINHFLNVKTFLLASDDKKSIPKILIEGNQYVNINKLIQSINKNLGKSKINNDLHIISDVLKQNQLIKKFIIKRSSKNIILIKIEEKHIIGFTSIKSKDFLIDRKNNLIPFKLTPNLFHIPFFLGKNSNKNANLILRLISESEINLNFNSFSFVNERRWNINLENGVKILLPEMKVLETLVLLKKVDAENNLLNGNFVEIDLRINGKYFLKPKIN